MEGKYNTDIDRKLAIYYHPLFQEVLNFTSGLFQQDKKLSLGLIEFLEFNLKLQKCLLPGFELQNAVVSGLNDWVKQVAECLSFEGMVNTSGCTEVTTDNIQDILIAQLRIAKIPLIFEETEYRQFIRPFLTHDAFKLLGVRINNEVFCKFLFDLCSTWCEFLDVQIFVYFLLTLALQISAGSDLQSSRFRSTREINTVDLDFFEEFQAMKNEYSRTKKKELRYYRAWCEWNYLRMNEIGERVIVDLHDQFPGEQRISSITGLFQRSIDTINLEITNQMGTENRSEDQRQLESSAGKPKQFLIFKKLDVKRNENSVPEQLSFIKKDLLADESQQENVGEFEIEVDQKGNMYLKRIVKMPILGTRIEPRPFTTKYQDKLQYLMRRKEEMRESSNLYRMESLQLQLPHNPNVGPTHYEKSKTIKQIEMFEVDKARLIGTNVANLNVTQTRTNGNTHASLNRARAQSHKESSVEMTVKQLQHSVHAKPTSKSGKSQGDFSMILDCDHKVMAPTFLTNKLYNISYANRLNQMYSSQIYDTKRNLRTNLPKVLNNTSTIKEQAKGTHLIGKLISDRKLIKAKVLGHDSNSTNTTVSRIRESQESRLEVLKQQSKHIWNRYVSEDEMRSLTDFRDFYERLWRFKKMFAHEFKSDYAKMIRLDIEYEDTRHQMGGVLTREDREAFTRRIQKLIARDERRKLRKKKRVRRQNNNNKTRAVSQVQENKVPTKFRSRQQRLLFNDVFIQYHRNEIKKTKRPLEKTVDSIKT